MNILVLQETDWLTRGPNTQHHIFERISKNIDFRITVLDYDIDRIKMMNIKEKLEKSLQKLRIDSLVYNQMLRVMDD